MKRKKIQRKLHIVPSVPLFKLNGTISKTIDSYTYEIRKSNNWILKMK